VATFRAVSDLNATRLDLTGLDSAIGPAAYNTQAFCTQEGISSAVNTGHRGYKNLIH